MDLPKRKHPRLKAYDYSQNGCYFTTVCVKNRLNLLGTFSVGRDALIPPHIELTDIGKIADKYIQNINFVYEDVVVDKYVIMPNHIHLLIMINKSYDDGGGMRASRPTLHTIIRSFKTMVTKQIGQAIWQASYYDKILRDEPSYCDAWKYIDENPLKWTDDELYNE